MSNTEENKELILGRNPVMEALKNKKEIEKLLVARGAEGSIQKILGMARDQKILVTYVEKAALDRLSDGVNHQGVLAYGASFQYCEPEDILALAAKRQEPPFVLILDGIEDPHNLGAIMRTAEVCGAHGIIIPKRRSVGVTEVVRRVSAGAAEYMACARVPNLAAAIESLKGKGLWIAACDMDGQTYYQADLKGPVGLVIGNEGQGISRLVKEKCDFSVSIPMRGRIESLNASNAAAVLMCEIRRQRDT